MIELSHEEILQLSKKILSSKKYIHLDVPSETVENLICEELKNRRNLKEVEKAVREKMHQIIALYLGDPDYKAASLELANAAAEGPSEIKAFCLKMLSCHTSSRERIPVMETFYEQIFKRIGKPASILDLACAMDPFSFPWMGLSPETEYHPYDIHRPRIDLINQYFSAIKMKPLGEVRDILLNPPEIKADAAFFFKEAHRFEARCKGCNREFWKSLKVEWLVVTLPAENLTGQHQMREREFGLVEKSTENLGWKTEEFEIADEMIFCIHKS